MGSAQQDLDSGTPLAMDDPRWSAAREFLKMAEARHGGRSAFSKINKITLHLHQMKGMIPFLKGHGQTFTMPERIDVSPNSRTVSFLFSDGTVRFKNGAIVSPTQRFENYRLKFKGWQRLKRWSNLDAAYFFGYSLVNYFSLPFLLSGLPIRAAKISSTRRSWIQFEFPPGTDTHSRLQKFWFDQTGLLIRHDYHADIIGPMTYGSHFSRDYRFDLPTPIAETRVVTFRIGSFAIPVVVLKAKFTVEEIE